MSKKKDLYATLQSTEELDAMAKRQDAEMNRISPVTIGTPVLDQTAGPKRGRFDHVFGPDPESAIARKERDTSFQAMLDSRKKAAEQARTDSVRMARYNALGNLLTTMVQPLGWAAGGNGFGSTGGVQTYDNRQYLEAFNRAVKASDDLRNIGTAEDEYRFKIANEDYNRALKLEDEARERKYKEADLAQKYAQRLEEIMQKHQNDLEKVEAQGEVRMAIAEFNASHRITSRGSGGTRITADERTKKSLLDGYLNYAKIEQANNRQPKKYTEWLADTGYTVSSTGGSGGGSGSSSRTGGFNL